MIKAVLFDIGGVLCRPVSDQHRSQWEQHLGLLPGALEKAIFDSPVARLGFVGKASDEDVWEAFRLKFNLSAGEVQAVYEDFWADTEWDAALLDAIRDLRPRYRTGVISDALPGARHEPRVKAHVNASLFDVILFSGEEGVMKPDAQIFDKALTLLGVQRGEAVFIDDSLRKVEGARALGMKAICFETREQTLTELRGWLDE